MVKRNKLTVSLLSTLITGVLVSFSICILFRAYNRNNGALLQERLRKAYEGLSPQDYE
jgi:hypothetical protein